MKTTLVLAVLFASLFTIGCHAQDIRLIDATECSGALSNSPMVTYYNIDMETSNYDIIPDTVWVQNAPSRINFSGHRRVPGKWWTIRSGDTVWLQNVAFPINFSGLNSRFMRTVDSIHHKVTFHLGITLTEPYLGQPTKKIPSKHYEGDALVTYMYEGKQYAVIIKQLRRLPGIQ